MGVPAASSRDYTESDVSALLLHPKGVDLFFQLNASHLGLILPVHISTQHNTTQHCGLEMLWAGFEVSSLQHKVKHFLEQLLLRFCPRVNGN